MMKETLFEKATRMKMRFPYRGMISVEDLWDLSIEHLDSVFKTLHSQMKKLKEESLLKTKSRDGEILDTKIAIVKYMVAVKLEEADARVKAKERKEKKKKLMSVLSTKQNEALMKKTPEELQKMLEELEK